MKSTIVAAGVLLQAGMSIAKPYLYETNGIVYNVESRDRVFKENAAAIEVRGMSLEQANVADSCMDSYNLDENGPGPHPTGRPDPDFDFFDFCSSFIRPTKTYTVTIRTSTPTPPVVTITVTATKTSTSTKPTTTSSPPPPPPSPPTTKSTSTQDVVTVTVTVTWTSTSTSSKPTTPPAPPTTSTTSKAPTATPTSTSVSTSSSTSRAPVSPTTSTTSKTPTLTRTSTSISSSSSSSQTPLPPSTTTVPHPPAATGSLCPTPIAGQICGVTGWGYAENNLYYGSSIDAATCHQLCLANPDCKSFQTQDSSYDAPQCNLYKVDSSGNNTIPGAAPYVFYDRGCPDYSPVGFIFLSPFHLPCLGRFVGVVGFICIEKTC
ncbi:hypothetical protein ONS96_003302 [Cadophora gregata f. sp. sojae]|nr:hypothetical protein ONS96_003302 [Cadophora gregata f. sp. sojae]